MSILGNFRFQFQETVNKVTQTSLIQQPKHLNQKNPLKKSAELCPSRRSSKCIEKINRYKKLFVISKKLIKVCVILILKPTMKVVFNTSLCEFALLADSFSLHFQIRVSCLRHVFVVPWFLLWVLDLFEIH